MRSANVVAALGRPGRFATMLLIAIPLLFTAAVLTEVTLNRRGGDLRAPFELSEREVSVAPRDDNNTATAVWLAWSDRVSPTQERRGSRDLARRVFVALAIDPARLEGSRLVVVDVADDAAVLERRYPDGRTHLIAAGLARTGEEVVNLDPVRIHVPRELAGQLPARPPRRVELARPTPFKLWLRYGRHWGPWVVNVSR